MATFTDDQLKALAQAEYARRMAVCERLGCPAGDLSFDSVLHDLTAMPGLAEELWQPLPEYEPAMSYRATYGAPRSEGERG